MDVDILQKALSRRRRRKSTGCEGRDGDAEFDSLFELIKFWSQVELTASAAWQTPTVSFHLHDLWPVVSPQWRASAYRAPATSSGKAEREKCCWACPPCHHQPLARLDVDDRDDNIGDVDEDDNAWPGSGLPPKATSQGR